MSKEEEKTAAPTIISGEPILVEAPTRKEANEKVAAIRDEAKKLGFIELPGGFVHRVRNDICDPGVFIATLTFKK